MESALDYHTAKALLEWQVEFGVTETISDTPINRFEVKPEPKKMAVAAVAETVAPVQRSKVSGVDLARSAAAGAGDVAALRAALGAFEECDLKRGARKLVFADGVFGSRVMIIGDAPERDEDREGRPFVGDAGVLLDKMLGAIDLNRSENVYLTTALPWRLPRNQEPKSDDLAMMLPFLERHVALAKPEFVVLMGNIACQAVLKKRGISRLRGEWGEAMGVPVLPMYAPEYLLGNPEKKREAWADLLSLKARLRG
ncbi:uracil-DNA glycosylase [Planktotalea sp.]|uniref:uracil-DNA glycosylase n=1 Tax=Planktotalea sp. TaxID=2029877 RepID=UPI0025CFBB5E|nr:uracil-DNA glycosylase [Planktotalea sp.]